MASVALVVVGIVGELWVGVVSADRNANLRSKNNRLVGLVREKASDAQVTAGAANKDAGVARRDAGNALLVQEQLKSKNLKLQEQILLMGPRANLLIGERRHMLVRSLKPFAGQHVEVGSETMLGALNGIRSTSASVFEERDGLVKAMIGVLTDARWRVTALQGPPPDSRGRGVNASIPSNAAKTQGAVEALAKALGKVPLAGVEVRSSPNGDGGNVVVFVHVR